ncbi:MFS general substrate transporter [Lizonia empirigonia]|nr:MFS general substrate transporter [Lizonia empirigonia]
MEEQETYRSIEMAESQDAVAAPGNQKPAPIFDLTRVTSIEPPPNGGWIAWSQVLGGHIVTFFVWGFITSFGMFQAYYTSAGVSTPSNISWIGSLIIFFLMLVPLWSGSASDAGHFKLLILRVGALLWLLGIFTTSVCHEYWQFLLAQGVFIGVANGFMFVPTMSVVSTYFDPSRRSLAIGLILCGSATGGMIFPIMLNLLFGMIGFGWAVRVFGFMALALLVLAERLLKKRLPPKDSAKFFEPGELKDIVFVLFIIGSFLNFSGLYFAFFYVNAYARNKLGMTLEETIPILMVLNGVGVPGRLIPMYLEVRFFRPIYVGLPINLVTALLLFVWIAIKSTASMYVFAVVYGLFASALQGLFPATMADLTIDPKKTGTRFGMGFALSSFGVLIGSPVGGALIEYKDGDYLYAQVFAGSCGILGFLCVGLAAFIHGKKMK